MTLFEIVALYVAINLILAPILMFRVGQVRLGKKINLGDGGDKDLISRIRAHGNFTENAPLLLVGLLALASLSAPPIVLHIFGASFTIGRVLHAMGMAGTLKQGRLIGTVTALLSYVGMAASLIYLIITT
jgi:uncharacterized membrane protein YecN with MAPEG domain